MPDATLIETTYRQDEVRADDLAAHLAHWRGAEVVAIQTLEAREIGDSVVRIETFLVVLRIRVGRYSAPSSKKRTVVQDGG